jgi:DNA-binding CsgD family transcriptional regulator
MWIEYASFVLTFIMSAGLSVIGIMVAYQLYQDCQKPVLQILLYQQIFLISFFVYGIWGNLALHEIIGDFNLNADLSKRLSVYIPILGIPFLVISWFMLLRFSFYLNGIKTSIRLAFIFFAVFIVLIFVFVLLIEKGVLIVPKNSDLFIIKTLFYSNLMIHLIFLLPFLKSTKNSPLVKEIGFTKKYAGLYFLGVLIYSIVLNYFDLFGFITTCIAILLLFAVSISIPLIIKTQRKESALENKSENFNFLDFCTFYEISKREAEIILEICTGKTNKAIAEKLFITLQTVKDHNYRIYSKTGVKSRGELTNLVREKTRI